MQVTFDCREMASQDTPFVLDMDCVPRVGEVVYVHLSLLPAFYFSENFGTPSVNELQLNEFLPIQIVQIYHKVSINTHVIEAWFSIEE